jgi:two-component system, NtrC family, response regulator AtoC
MTAKRILIIDDEKNMRHMLQVMLGKEGYITDAAADGMEALSKMDGSSFDFVLCDIKMPKMDGLTFLKLAKEKYPEKTFIMMSAYGTIDTALDAMKLGAYDYIAKPFKSDEALLTLKKAEERERLKEENLQLNDKINRIEQKYSFGNMIAKSEAMAKIFDLVERVADYKTTVLITGESGTGKELIAKAIHSKSSRGQRPMVSVNCGGIPETLLESELFGYKKGAFTDAVRDKPGLFEEADGTTIFLDEIGELPIKLQVKLLRVLQEAEITPLGSTVPKKIDTRIVAATSRDLKEEVEQGRFREDLFYRINVMAIHLPPLRERRGDIPLLTGHFIDSFNKKMGKNIEGLSSEAMAFLLAHRWAGNIRELENVIERAMILARDNLITPSELPPAITSSDEILSQEPTRHSLSVKKETKLLEIELIRKVLDLTGGNRTNAAKILEISRPILISKIKEYGLE